MLPFAVVSALSDDEPVLTQSRSQASSSAPSGQKARQQAVLPERFRPARLRARIGLLVGQLCNCVRKNKRASFRKSCMAQFRNETEELFQLSLRLRRLAKQDMDNEARSC